ncbi:MAG: hypothetical protein ACLPTB_15430 [Acidimicrobiales bacterium]|jgi:hypothetical protein
MLTVIGGSRPSRRPDIEIRTPAAARLVHAGVLLAGAAVATIVTVVLASRGTPWAVVSGIALAVWVSYYYRLFNMAVVVRGDHLTARNLFSTRRIERSRVGAVTLGESAVAKSPNQTVVLALVGGQRVALDACARTLQSPRTRRRVEEFQRRLEHWSRHGPDATFAADRRALTRAGPEAP